MFEYDVVIMGAGIGGMTASIYLKRANIKCLVIEKDAPGGELNRIGKIENYPGFDSIMGVDLAYNIYNQSEKLGCEYLFERVKEIDSLQRVIKTDRKIIKYKYLIMATGRRPKGLGLKDEDKLVGRGISYCAICDGGLYRDREVIVIGGGNSAISEALYLANICKKVTIIHRSSELRGNLGKEELDRNNIEIIYNKKVEEYVREEDKIKGVRLDDGSFIKGEGIFLAVGSIPNSDLIDVDKDKGYIIVDRKCMSSNKYIYAIGDVIKKDIYQLTTASGEGSIAASEIINNLSIKN